MSSTVTPDRPARQALPDQLTVSALPADKLSNSLPLDPSTLPTLGPETSLAPASGSAPALADLLFDDIDITSTPPAEGTEAKAAAPFKITDLSTASWAASKVLAAQARIAERAALAQAYKAKIEAWLADSCKVDESSASYLSMLLKPFIESELSRSHSRSRTLHLPTASASLRKAPDRVSIQDEAAALAYLEAQHPTAVIIKKTISFSTLRSLIFTQGEAVPGIEAELGRDSLYLKPRS